MRKIIVVCEELPKGLEISCLKDNTNTYIVVDKKMPSSIQSQKIKQMKKMISENKI